MRIRTIKPEFWRDEKTSALPYQVRLLYIGCWNLADDYGILRGNPKLIKADLFPYDDALRSEQLEQWIGQLVKARMLIPFTLEGESYLYIRTFGTHQKIDKPSKTGLIGPDKFARSYGLPRIPNTFGEYSESIRGVFLEYSTEEKEMEREREMEEDMERGYGGKQKTGESELSPIPPLESISENSSSRTAYPIAALNVKQEKEKSSAKKEKEYPPEIQEAWTRFRQWIDENAPRVAKMKEPFTIDEFARLKEDFHVKVIQEVLKAMHNYEPLHKKSRSANLTFRKWAAKDESTKYATNGNHSRLHPINQPVAPAEAFATDHI